MAHQSRVINLSLKSGGDVVLRKSQIAAVIEKKKGSRVVLLSGVMIDVTQTHDVIGHQSWWVDL